MPIMKRRILVVDDSQDLRYTLEALLKNYHFKIESAESAEVALKKIAREIPDVIISDIMLPNKDGIEFVRDIRVNDDTMHVPVILLTAKNEKAIKLAGYEVGANHFMTKPYDADELVSMINSSINHVNRITRSVLSRPERPKGENRTTRFFKAMNSLIQDNIGNPDFHYSDIAKVVNLSPSALQKKVLRLTGKPISQYMREYRLKVARTMLENDHYSISEISKRVGFNSLSYFSRTFHDYYNITPRQARNRQQYMTDDIYSL